MTSIRLVLDSPIGPLTLVATGSGLSGLRFGRPGAPAPDEPSLLPGQDHPTLRPTSRLLARQLAGEAVDWSPVPMDLQQGTDFQQAVWQELRRIPHGSVVSYGDIARRLGRGSPRAVGQAVGANPIPVVIPCHRVVTEDRRLGGFSGGLERKVRLLASEGIHFQGTRITPEPALRLAL